jgi:hypothetical protein
MTSSFIIYLKVAGLLPLLHLQLLRLNILPRCLLPLRRLFTLLGQDGNKTLVRHPQHPQVHRPTFLTTTTTAMMKKAMPALSPISWTPDAVPWTRKRRMKGNVTKMLFRLN